jgi:hypothetical protein
MRHRAASVAQPQIQRFWWSWSLWWPFWTSDADQDARARERIAQGLAQRLRP